MLRTQLSRFAEGRGCGRYDKSVAITLSSLGPHSGQNGTAGFRDIDSRGQVVRAH